MIKSPLSQWLYNFKFVHDYRELLHVHRKLGIVSLIHKQNL